MELVEFWACGKRIVALPKWVGQFGAGPRTVATHFAAIRVACTTSSESVNLGWPLYVAERTANALYSALLCVPVGGMVNVDCAHFPHSLVEDWLEIEDLEELCLHVRHCGSCVTVLQVRQRLLTCCD